MTIAVRKPTPGWPQSVKVGPTGQIMLQVMEFYPNKADVVLNSGLDSDHGPRPNGSHHYGLRYAGSPTCALDFVSKRGAAGMRDLARWLYQWSADTVELIHTTPFANDQGFYVNHGSRWPGGRGYGNPNDSRSTAGQHKDHVHWAASKAQLEKILANLRRRFPVQPKPKPVPPKVTPPPPSAPKPPVPNPNPASISAPMWRFWCEFKAFEPNVLLGGIYANKPGYHNKRNALPAGDYSVRYKLDKAGPADKAAAIDLTFPTAQRGSYTLIARYAARLLNSGRDMKDERGNYLREFYGQSDGDTQVEGWDFQALINVSSDSSHLWHIHLSFMRAYLNDWKAFDAVLSILKGETVAAWRKRHAA